MIIVDSPLLLHHHQRQTRKELQKEKLVDRIVFLIDVVRIRLLFLLHQLGKQQFNGQISLSEASEARKSVRGAKERKKATLEATSKTQQAHLLVEYVFLKLKTRFVFLTVKNTH